MMKKSGLFLVLISFFTSAHAEYEDGLKNYAIGKYSDALEHFVSCKSEVKCIFGLGVLYEKGRGVNVDKRKAEELYSAASFMGYAPAQFNLGLLYDRGDGVSQDYKKAVQWYEAAAAQGNAKAQNNLGILYTKGLGGLEKDFTKASLYFSNAMRQNSDAKINLATISAALN